MLKKLGIVLLILLVILGGIACYIALQPGDYRVERSIKIAAPAAVVFAQVNDFHKWDAWSPWIKLDPQAKSTFEGPAAGKGAIMRWAGNSNVGKGSMTLTESTPPERIQIKLDFIEPMAGTSNVEFAFKPEADQTRVTWTITGQNNFVGKAMCLVMSMDKMIGDQFEAGLASMKAAAEKSK